MSFTSRLLRLAEHVYATKFNAKTHAAFIIDTFDNLGFEDVSDFAVAQISDSTNTNPKIARELGIEHIGCRCHALNRAGVDMEQSDTRLRDLSDQTHECLKTIRMSNKLTAGLRNVQEKVSSLSLKAQTRWNSLVKVFDSHEKAKDDIKALIDQNIDPNSKVSTIPSFDVCMLSLTAFLLSLSD